MNKGSKIIFSAGIIIFACGFAFSKEFISGVRNGMSLCAGTVIPSLFIFMCAASLIGNADMPKFLKKAVTPIMKIQGLPPEAFSAVVLGLFAGYPAGARALTELMKAGRITPSQRNRMMRFCLCPGAGFSINAVGASMLGSRKSGYIILASVCISSLIIAIISSATAKKEALNFDGLSVKNPYEAIVESVSSGCTSMLIICGFVSLFCGIGNIINLIPMDERAKILLQCFVEVTGGCVKASPCMPLPLITGICAFGGFCVHMQVLAICNDGELSIADFLIFRFIHASLSALVCIVLLKHFPVEASAIQINSDRLVLNSISLPASVSLMFLASLTILDLDNNKKIC